MGRRCIQCWEYWRQRFLTPNLSFGLFWGFWIKIDKASQARGAVIRLCEYASISRFPLAHSVRSMVGNHWTWN